MQTTISATVNITGTAKAGVTPTGLIEFFSSSTQGFLGAAQVNAAGTATIPVTFTVAGAQNFYGHYVGDSNYAGSGGPSYAITVQAGTNTTVATSTTLAVATSTPTVGVATTLTATVAVTGTAKATAPTGIVNFYSSSTQGLLGSAAVSGTTATLPVTFTVSGAQSVYALYAGDTNYAPSGSAAVNVTAAAGTTTTSATTTTVAITSATPTVASQRR